MEERKEWYGTKKGCAGCRCERVAVAVALRCRKGKIKDIRIRGAAALTGLAAKLKLTPKSLASRHQPAIGSRPVAPGWMHPVQLPKHQHRTHNMLPICWAVQKTNRMSVPVLGHTMACCVTSNPLCLPCLMAGWLGCTVRDTHGDMCPM